MPEHGWQQPNRPTSQVGHTHEAGRNQTPPALSPHCLEPDTQSVLQCVCLAALARFAV